MACHTAVVSVANPLKAHRTRSGPGQGIGPADDP